MAFIVRDLFLDDLQSVSWSGSPTHLKYVAEAIERASKSEVDYLVIHVDGAPRGIGGVDYAVNTGVGTLFQLSVHPDYQSQGIGTALIRALEKRTLDRGFIVTELSVELDNIRARILYERLGYNIVGTKTESWKEEKDDGELMMYTCQCLHMRKVLQ
jgi:ribosomal protein S18 acetylase RimI-like enzyme